jgi:putative membrane protein
MWDYGFGWFFPNFLWIIILVLFFWFIWGDKHNSCHRHEHFEEDKSPEQILADRFARGEIDESDYTKRLDTLKKHKS